MVYADVTQVKKILTEKGPVEDGKVQLYCIMADNYINKDLVNIASIPTIPIPNPPVVLANIATALACAYFYKFESGDTITAEEAETQWKEYFDHTYKRPRLIFTTGTYGGAPSGINYASYNGYGG